MKRRVVVGVDGGGTKTLALASELDGHWHGQGVGGPSNLHAVGFENACAAIEVAINKALAGNELAALCLGLAGAGRPEDVQRFTDWARTKYSGAVLKVVSDAEILLAADTSTGPALVLICGTGSIVYGRKVSGELVRAGGWGYLFGDEGSGFAIGAAALRAVMKAYDGLGADTSLTTLILTQHRLKDPMELVPHIYRAELPRTEIAGLSELVERAAEQSDRVAVSILEEAAHDLAQMVMAVFNKLGTEPVSLILTGSVIVQGTYLAEAFQRQCARLGLTFSNIISVYEPAQEALYVAQRMISG